jgi:multidrug efflux pump subunit AcrA (membrane-fusion protein)
MMKKTKIFIALLLAASAIFLLACAGSKRGAPAKADAKGQADESPIEVSTAPVIERSLRRSLEVVGSLEAEDQVTVSSQAAGNLEEINIDIGTPVRLGQVIARIDSRELKLRVEQAEAALRQAEARLGLKSGERFDPQNQPDVRQARAALERARYDLRAAEDLVESGDISRQQLDIARRTFEQAEARYQAALENVRNLEASVQEKRAQLALAKKQLADANIVSPISGIVKEKIASRGEYLQPGKPIATIVRIDRLRLKLEVPETFAASVGRGQVVSLKVDTVPDREFRGQIKRVSPSLDEKNRSLIVEAEVINPGPLKPGMFARAQIISSTQSTALMVPEKALVSLAGVNKVYVIEGGRAVERQVKLGARDGAMVEIVSGVRAGEHVITSNTDKLQDGAVVSASVKTEAYRSSS